MSAWKTLVRLAGTLVAVATTVVACGTDDSTGSLVDTCSLTSDCQPGKVCAFARCRAACNTTADCPKSAIDATQTRCVRSDIGPDGVCLVQDESECKTSGDCPLGKVCAVDRTCRDGCLNDVDCLGKQRCVARTCAEENELVDGGLAVADGGGDVVCTHDSECAPYGQVCLDRVCRRECVANVDCSAGLLCSSDGRCIGPDDPTCTTKSCQDQGWNCGVAPSGCQGGAVVCGGGQNQGCLDGQTCGGAGRANVCGPGTCAPKTCSQLQQTCGIVSDGCGATLDCGTCAADRACGSDGVCRCTPEPNLCAGRCGTVTDRCGSRVECGGCTVGSTCSAEGTCTCTVQQCAEAGECGSRPDGCGGVLTCGTACGTGQSCRSGNPNNYCGDGACTPTATCRPGDCGPIPDGCGATLDCGQCQGAEVCGATVANRCGCAPKVCRPNQDCGPVADGCGATTDCGACDDPFTCGGGGTPSICGCTRHTCEELGRNCGYVDDGCGTLLPCGSVTCAGGKTCGGAGEPNVCGVPRNPGDSCHDANGAVVAGGCGIDGTEDCCKVQPIPEGVFDRHRWNYVGVYNPDYGYLETGALMQQVDPPVGEWRYPAHVSSFSIDAYEVTVGRFRRYLASGGFTRYSPPSPGAGRNPHVPQTVAETGWRHEWNPALPPSAEAAGFALRPDAQQCSSRGSNPMGCADDGRTQPFTLTVAPGAQEAEPMVGVNWYQAFAFCVWDGGRLPTESEWLYVAAGGAQQLPYPWGANRASYGLTDVAPQSAYNNDSCFEDYGDWCGAAGDHHVRVGSKGSDAFGVSGMFGLGFEWLLDTRDGAPTDQLFPHYDCQTQDCAWTFESHAPTYDPSAVGHRIRGGKPGFFGVGFDMQPCNDQHAPRWQDEVRAGGQGRPVREDTPYGGCSRNMSMTDPIGFRCARDL